MFPFPEVRTRAIAGLLFVFGLASLLPAQTAGTATLLGTVSDSTGAIISSAKVSVINLETSFASETSTTTEGSYYVPYLAPGSYRLTVEAAGFKRYVRE